MTERTVAGLRCSEVLARLSDYIDGELGAAEVKDVEEHLLSCPNCERFGKNFGSMVVSLRSRPETAHPVDSELVTRLLAQLDELSPASALPRRLLNRVYHLARRNTLAGNRRNIQDHYDLGNDLYREFLDPTMMYSSGIFEQLVIRATANIATPKIIWFFFIFFTLRL